jgi:hypothetical protein
LTREIQVVRDHAIETQGLATGAERYGALHIATAMRDGEGVASFVDARLLGVRGLQVARNSKK